MGFSARSQSKIREAPIFIGQFRKKTKTISNRQINEKNYTKGQNLKMVKSFFLNHVISTLFVPTFPALLLIKELD